MKEKLHENALSFLKERYDNTHLNLPLRMRRNRKSPAIRSLVAETSLLKSDLVLPFFIIEGERKKEAIASMPGIFRLSPDLVLREAEEMHTRGIQGIALFPVTPSDLKSEQAEEALRPDSLLHRTLRLIKKEIPSLCLISDVALDPYTTHGHDGLANKAEEILNDETVRLLGKMAVAQAEAGADVVAPSDMMDGRVGFIRRSLDLSSFQNTSILAYSAKYASSFYSPFRDALQTELSFGDKKTYQMHPGNVREALLEAELDEKEGADILMVKPAGMYLDVIAKLRERTHRPVAAYHVSGEYAMVMAAYEKGYLHAPSAFYETLLGIKRAGANLIFTYAVEQVLEFLDN